MEKKTSLNKTQFPLRTVLLRRDLRAHTRQSNGVPTILCVWGCHDYAPTADVGEKKGLGILGFNIPNSKFPDGDMPLAEPSVHLYGGVGKNGCQPNKLRQQLLKVYRLLKQGPQMTSTQ